MVLVLGLVGVLALYLLEGVQAVVAEELKHFCRTPVFRILAALHFHRGLPLNLCGRWTNIHVDVVRSKVNRFCRGTKDAWDAVPTLVMI